MIDRLNFNGLTAAAVNYFHISVSIQLLSQFFTKTVQFTAVFFFAKKKITELETLLQNELSADLCTTVENKSVKKEV